MGTAVDDVDIDIILASQSQAPADAEFLSSEYAVVVGHPSERAHIDASELAVASRVQVIGFDDLWGRFFAEHGVAEIERTRVAVDTSSAAIELVSTTPGWYALVPARYAVLPLEAGSLRLAADSSIAMTLSQWLHVTSDRDRRASPAVVAVAGWLRSNAAIAPDPTG